MAMVTCKAGFDFSDVMSKLSLLLRDAESGVLEDLFKLITDMPRDALASFFGKLFKPSYLPVNGTGKHIAELRFVLPGGADELLAAFRAGDGEGWATA
jgi:hypothetical protein